LKISLHFTASPSMPKACFTWYCSTRRCTLQCTGVFEDEKQASAEFCMMQSLILACKVMFLSLKQELFTCNSCFQFIASIFYWSQEKL